MGRYVIERDLPGAGDLTERDLHDISAKSNAVIERMSGITWLESYVTDDKLYCVYEADDAALIEQHAREGDFPCTKISEVRGQITPESGR